MTEIDIDSTYGLVIIQDLKIVYADNNYANMYGYENKACLLKSVDSFLDLIPEKSHESVKQRFANTISGQMIPRGKTFINIDRHGKPFTVFSVDHIIEWEKKPALQVTVIDLSILVEANKKNREKDLMFKRLIMNSGQGILVHRDFKPLLVNNAWVEAMHGDSIEQVMSLDSMLQFILPENHQQAKKHYQQLISGMAESKSNIVENICFDGKKRFFNAYDNTIEWEGEPAIQVVLEDVTDKVEFEKALAYRASHDQLTNLFNRSAVYDWLDEHLKIHDNVHCILIDIDDFKEVNDTHGHQVGDQVIKSISTIIKNTVQELNGVSGRWGGEEFIIFMPNTAFDKTFIMAESIRTSFNKVKHHISPDCSFNSSVSIGISSHYACHGIINIDNLIKATDKLLYRAKEQGKNRIMGNEPPPQLLVTN